jgi:rhodanese-related sulfurtransferase
MFSIFGKSNFDSVSVNELEGKINLIDVREGYEFKTGHVPSAKNVPLGTILTEPEKYLDKTKQYHIICQSGARSKRACKGLSSKGYNVINVFDGTGAYKKSLRR